MKRAQLTLFLSGVVGEKIERIRRVVDPLQSALIGAHVTLCRDDELAGIEPAVISARLAGLTPIVLSFGPAERRREHGILLPCVRGRELFSDLRRKILGANARLLDPHLTIAHPRNPRAPGNSLAAVNLAFPIVARFERIALIEQDAPDLPWRALAEFPLTQVLLDPTRQSGR